jgi:hypothetical protein
MLRLHVRFYLADTIFDPDVNIVPLWCTFPLNRALFYVLMAVALLFCRRLWISTSTLGGAMVYADVSAIQFWAILGNFQRGQTAADTDSSRGLLKHVDSRMDSLTWIFLAFSQYLLFRALCRLRF